MLGLKLLECARAGTFFVTVFLGWFVLVTQFLYSQSLAFAAFLMLPFLAFLYLLARLHGRGEASPLALALRSCASRCSRCRDDRAVRALPAAGRAALGLPWIRRGAQGLSDTLSPARCRAWSSPPRPPRVRFEGDLPPPAQRIGAARALGDDGRTWARARRRIPAAHRGRGPLFDYE